MGDSRRSQSRRSCGTEHVTAQPKMRVTLLAGLAAALLTLASCASPSNPPVPESTVSASTQAPASGPTSEPTPEPKAEHTTAPPTAPTATHPPQEPAPVPTPEPVQEGDAPAGADPAVLASMSERVETAMDAFAQSQQFSGVVLVASGGEIAFAQGYGYADRAAGLPNSTKTRYRIGSVTKPITAVLILMLQERGLLDIADTVCTYVQPCPEAWAAITIEHLLAHTAGIPNFTDFPDFEQTKRQPSTLTETIDRFRQAPLDFPPGERWNYSDSGYIVLGQIIETVTGDPYEDVARELIFEPLEMTDTDYDHNRDDLAVGYGNTGGAEADFIHMSIPHAAGALYSTAEDLLKLDRALAEGKLLSPTWQEAMFTPHAQIPGDPNVGYGYGWVMTERFGRPIAFHNGGIEGFVAHVTRVLGDEILIVMLSNQQQTNPRAVQETLLRAIYAD